jgi:DNA-binding response OmpR family regulator
MSTLTSALLYAVLGDVVLFGSVGTRILVVDDSSTIRSVVSAILEKSGYEPRVAADGQDAYEALASGDVKADLVLLDFVMPRMNGYEFCRALRANAELAATPVVLMSARADHIREHFVQQTGALDAITKPFDRQALVTVIDNALRKVNAKANRISSARLLEPEPSTVEAGRGTVVVSAEGTSRTQVAQLAAQRLAGLAVRVVTGNPGIAPAELTALLSERFSGEAMPELVELLGDLERVERSRALLSGDMAVVPIGAILQLLQAEQQTGVLVCTSEGNAIRAGEASRTEVRATFREGAIDLVQSTGAGDEFRLGRFFIDEGILTESEIEAVTLRQQASSPKPSRTPLGMTLLATGKIVETQLRSALVRQSSELLYEVIRWPSGRFELRRDPPSELASSAKLGLPVASVVMEGFRRVDEWRAIERALGSFDAVLFRDDVVFSTLAVGTLPPKERAVLDVVDGERSVRAIVAASRQSSFDACRILAQFLEARVLRRRLR